MAENNGKENVVDLQMEKLKKDYETAKKIFATTEAKYIEALLSDAEEAEVSKLEAQLKAATTRRANAKKALRDAKGGGWKSAAKTGLLILVSVAAGAGAKLAYDALKESSAAAVEDVGDNI